MKLYFRMYDLVEYVRNTNNATGNDRDYRDFAESSTLHESINWVKEVDCLKFLQDKHKLDHMEAEEIYRAALERNYLVRSTELVGRNDVRVRLGFNSGLEFLQKTWGVRLAMYNGMLNTTSTLAQIVLGGLTAAIVSGLITLASNYGR